ncbi:hypothetical protein ABIB82_005362 [Bradyrhizobium sp. i1.8.4]|uniref:hypothetical protein n=1 Tax=unclassified Bradyrhizobium TaxID=2631580 RepID=UPI003D246069
MGAPHRSIVAGGGRLSRIRSRRNQSKRHEGQFGHWVSPHVDEADQARLLRPMTVDAGKLFHHARSPNRERPITFDGPGNTGTRDPIHLIKAARKRGDDGMESLMIDLRRFRRSGLAAVLSAAMATSCFAQPTVQEPNAHGSNETATRPWSAPVGHRQPRAADIPAAASASQQIIDQEDAIVDRKIKGICRGC